MKKRRYSLIGLYSLVFLLFCACGKQQGRSYFRATVIEVSGDIILVEPVKGSAELRDADSFHVVNRGKIDIYVGDIVEVEYEGILESDPPQLGREYGIKVIKESKGSRSQKLIPMVQIILDRLEPTGSLESQSILAWARKQVQYQTGKL